MHIHSTPESLTAFVQRGIEGPVTMLNLLKFRDEADYSASPELAPQGSASGEAVYATYIELVLPLLASVGAEATFTGDGGAFLVGPLDERWDRAILVRYPSVEAFVGFVSMPEYQAVSGHRTAALADSRLLPLT